MGSVEVEGAGCRTKLSWFDRCAMSNMGSTNTGNLSGASPD